MKTKWLATLVLALGSGCSLLVGGQDSADDDPSACGRIEVLAQVDLSSAVPFGAGFRNLVGHRRFTTAGGVAFLASSDGRLLAVDLRDPARPVTDQALRLPAELAVRLLAAHEDRLFAVADRSTDDSAVLVELGLTMGTDPTIWPLSGAGSLDLELSVGGGCLFVAGTFADVRALAVEQEGAPPVSAELGGSLVVGRDGLGRSSLQIVRAEVTGETCTVEPLSILGSSAPLGASERDRLWLVEAQTFSARTVDENEYTVSVDRAIRDLRVVGDLIVVAADRDVLIYRRRAPTSRPVAVKTIALAGRALATAPVFEDDPRWLAVLVANEAIENETSFMSVLTFDLEALCP